jgi:hypothetical protein
MAVDARNPGGTLGETIGPIKKPFGVPAEGLFSESVGATGFEPATSCTPSAEQVRQKLRITREFSAF